MLFVAALKKKQLAKIRPESTLLQALSLPNSPLLIIVPFHYSAKLRLLFSIKIALKVFNSKIEWLYENHMILPLLLSFLFEKPKDLVH